MTTNSIAQLTDRELLDETARAVDRERRTTAELLALLAELDARKLYLGEGYSSLFSYCTHVLRLSEPAAYSRITAARASRRFPILLEQLAAGDITLTTVSLLAGHLTDENHDTLLAGARFKSKRDIERLVVSLHPQPDISASVRKLPEAQGSHTTASAAPREIPSEVTDVPEPVTRAAVPMPARRAVVAPLASERYLMRITIDVETHRKLDRARDLLRHVIPDGDPAAIVGRALTLLVDQLEKRRTASTTRPPARRRSASVRSGGYRQPCGERSGPGMGADAHS